VSGEGPLCIVGHVAGRSTLLSNALDRLDGLPGERGFLFHQGREVRGLSDGTAAGTIKGWARPPES